MPASIMAKNFYREEMMVGGSWGGVLVWSNLREHLKKSLDAGALFGRWPQDQKRGSRENETGREEKPT